MKHPIFKYVKYQSLGNDFILLDWRSRQPQSIIKDLKDPHWPILVADWCNRKTNIGADGILVLSMHEKTPHVGIYNADGSAGQACINGVRCVAHHLFKEKESMPMVDIMIDSYTIRCHRADDITQSTLQIPMGEYKGTLDIAITDTQSVTGHIISTGNPHLIIPTELSSEWLLRNAERIEQMPAFAHKTNIEVCWPSHRDELVPSAYNMLVHERGVGPTRACGSGAAALMTVLYHQKKITPESKVIISMPGGNITTWIDTNNRIYQQAPAQSI